MKASPPLPHSASPRQVFGAQRALARHAFRQRQRGLDNSAVRAVWRQMARHVEHPDALPVVEQVTQVFR